MRLTVRRGAAGAGAGNGAPAAQGGEAGAEETGGGGGGQEEGGGAPRQEGGRGSRPAACSAAPHGPRDCSWRPVSSARRRADLMPHAARRRSGDSSATLQIFWVKAGSTVELCSASNRRRAYCLERHRFRTPNENDGLRTISRGAVLARRCMWMKLPLVICSGQYAFPAECI